MSLPTCPYRIISESYTEVGAVWCDALTPPLGPSCEWVLRSELCPEGWDGGAMCYPVEYEVEQ